MDCGDNGYCLEGECVCDKWYSGPECRAAYNKDFEGEYFGTKTVATRGIQRSFTLEADRIVPNRMEIVEANIHLEFDSDTSFIIPLQGLIWEGDSLWVAGRGSYETEAIRFTLGEQHPYSSNSEFWQDHVLITFSGIRQSTDD
ncbi:MAG: hypothetical protein Salg2KO_22290 [Salibacteraceae bacterium]